MMISKIKYYFNIAWKKYHFIIPFSEIKRFFHTRFRNKKNNLFNASEQKKWQKNSYPVFNKTILEYKPLISVIIPVYNVKRKYLVDCIESVLNQSYDNFEICLVDDASTMDETINTLKEYENNPKIKIKYHKTNTHISKTSNDAIKMAKGEYVVFLDDDDFIDKDALYEIATSINEHKDTVVIYSDEDKVSSDGKIFHAPFFKPDYSPNYLLLLNYMCHLVAIKKTYVDKVGGFRVGYEGVQDWDLFIRVTELTDKIYHIPRILYHWREIETSTAQDINNKPYVIERTKMFLTETLKRRRIDADLSLIKHNMCRLNYAKQKATVSIILYGESNNITNIINNINYDNYEIIVNKNDLSNNELNKIKDYNNLLIIDSNEKKESSFINLACKKSKGEFILLLNNNLVINDDNWLNDLVGYAKQKNVGAVGVNYILNNNIIYYGNQIWTTSSVCVDCYEPIQAVEGIYSRMLIAHNVSVVRKDCILFEKKKYELVKGFDSKYSLDAGIIDFCLKLINHGYYNAIEPNIRFLTNEFSKNQMTEKEKCLLLNKWKDIYPYDPFYNYNLDDTKPYYLKSHFNSNKHVFIIGSRGYDFNYGGWETFVTNLINKYPSTNVVFHVSGIGPYESHIMVSNNLYLDYFPLNKLGKLQMYMHTCKSFKYYYKYIKDQKINNGYIYVLGLKLGNKLHKYHKKINKLGLKIMINPDGLEWKRGKYGIIGKMYFLNTERSMINNSDLIICDAKGIYNYIKNKYKKNKNPKKIITYGTIKNNDYLTSTELLDKYNLKKDDYLLVVGRLVPENNLSFIIKEYLKSKIKKKLVIITNESNDSFNNWCQKNNIVANNNIIYLSSIYNEKDIFSIRKYAWAYIHGHSVGGTNPSLLESLFTSPLVIAYNVCFNKDICKDSALYFTLKDNSLTKVLNNYKQIDKNRQEYHQKAVKIIEKNHTWEYIASEYKKIWEDDTNE